jgi:tRNA A37 methylthiotransferase MiaB
MTEYQLTKPYSKGFYNEFDDQEQHIRVSEGCPNKCPYCAEAWENGIEPIYYDIPEIIRNKVIILDMNLIYKPKEASKP